MKTELVVVDKRSYIKAAVNLGQMHLSPKTLLAASANTENLVETDEKKPGETRQIVLRLIDFIKEH